jgi:hypothetical protein
MLQPAQVEPIGSVGFSNLRLWLGQMEKSALEKQKM